MAEKLPLEKILPWYFLFDPNDRIFIIYLLSAFLIAAIYFFYRFRSMPIKKFIWYLFNPKILLHHSTRVDIYLFIFNYWIRIMLIVPFIFSEITVVEKIKYSLTYIFPNYQSITLNPITYSLIYTLVLFIVADFFRFIYHYFSHTNSFLWELHKVHHSAVTLNPLTTYRVHPLDVVILIFKQILVTGLVAGIFSFLVEGEYALYTIFGVQFMGFIINFFGANLRHSHIPISFGKKLETFFISPVMHQMHHAINSSNNMTNLGSNLSIWDILFKTYRRPNFKPMRFGLSKSQRSAELTKVLINPFICFSFQKKNPVAKKNLSLKNYVQKYSLLKKI